MKKILLAAVASFLLTWASAQTYVGKRFPSHEQKLNNEYCSNLFRNVDGTILNIANDGSAKGYLNILDWLQGRVAGLTVYHMKDGTPIAFIRNSRASIFLDELPISAESLSMISVADLAMVKVIKTPFVGAFGNSAGVIAIYSLRGDDDIDESGDDG